MPRNSKPNSKRHRGQKVAPASCRFMHDLSEQSKNWFITMTKVHGTGYIEAFKKANKNCTFAEWYYELNADQTFNIYAYIQYSVIISSAQLIMKVNCRSKLKRTTIADKLMSSFNAVPNKLKLGTERYNEIQSRRARDNANNDLVPVDTTVKFVLGPVSKPVCWLPQPPKIDCLLNRKKIYPVGYDE